MQQCYRLEDIIYKVKKLRPNLSIGMYTGYSRKELDEGKYKYLSGNSKFYISVYDGAHPWQRIQHMLDFAIMGRFNQQKLDTSTSLRSSTNQELVLFSDRYKESDFAPQEIQFTLKDGLVNITGFPVGMPELLEARNW